MDLHAVLGRRRRVVVRLHWSTLLVPGALALMIAIVVMPRIAPRYPVVVYGLAGAGMAALVVVSVLVHEFAHVAVARCLKAGVERVSLGLDGGSTELTDEPRTARAEFLISAAGPVTNMVTGGVFLLAAAAGTVLRCPLLVLACLVFMAIINGVLAVVNLLPAFATDGAQMLCAVLWHHSGDRARAVAAVGWVSRVFGGALFAAGVVLMFTRGILSGLWLAGLAAFVAGSVRNAE